MKATLPLLIIALLLLAGMAYSQNPYQSIGKEVKILTLSGGKFKEFHPNDSLRRVGSVIVNIRTKEVYQFIERDTLYSESTLDPTVISRWLSLDPEMAQYPSISPYAFALNSPIFYIDPDGGTVEPSKSFKSSGYYGTYLKLIASNSVYKKMLSTYIGSKVFNYNLNKEVESARNPKGQGTTTELAGTRRESVRAGGIIAVDSKTDFYSKNETRQFASSTGTLETYSLNELGKAFVLIHEASHAELISFFGTEYAGHDVMARNGSREDIVMGLKEFRDSEGLDKNKFTDDVIDKISYYGLAGTKEFNEKFGLTGMDMKSSEYKDAVDGIYDQIEKDYLYTEKK